MGSVYNGKWFYVIHFHVVDQRDAKYKGGHDILK